MIRLINLVTLIALGLIDYRSYKIPNVVLCGWLGTIILYLHLEYTTPGYIIPRIIGALIVTGSYIFFRQLVRCCPGDFKLFAALTVAIGMNDMLSTLFITSVISLFPLACGVKKVPMAFTTCFGYIAFLLMRMEG